MVNLIEEKKKFLVSAKIRPPKKDYFHSAAAY